MYPCTWLARFWKYSKKSPINFKGSYLSSTFAEFWTCCADRVTYISLSLIWNVIWWMMIFEYQILIHVYLYVNWSYIICTLFCSNIINIPLVNYMKGHIRLCRRLVLVVMFVIWYNALFTWTFAWLSCQ